MLPADSALIAVLPPREQVEPATKTSTGSWGDLAKTLASSEGMQKGGVSRAV